MRKLTVAAFISLDGVMQGPGAPDEDLSGGFGFGGWIVPYTDEACGEAIMALFSQPFELLLGRRTYDIFAAHWPPIHNHAIADPFNRVPKHVATHRSETLGWHNSHALEGNVVEAIRALKSRKGADLLTQGSGNLVRQLLAAGLVDELQLMTFPVVLGRGKRLFDEDAQASAFTMTHASSTPTGVVITRYARSGDVRTGTFGEAK